jgi:hypothetical protein
VARSSGRASTWTAGRTAEGVFGSALWQQLIAHAQSLGGNRECLIPASTCSPETLETNQIQGTALACTRSHPWDPKIRNSIELAATEDQK